MNATIIVPEGIEIIGDKIQPIDVISRDSQEVTIWNAVSDVPGSYIIMVTATVADEDGGIPEVVAQATVIVEITDVSRGGGGGGGGTRSSPEIGFRPETLAFTAVLGEGNPEPQTLQVFTTRNRSALRFTIETDVPWLDAGPIEGISDATNDRERITVSVMT